jgi:diguanylate cyclase (GGDEF)-like protein
MLYLAGLISFTLIATYLLKKALSVSLNEREKKLAAIESEYAGLFENKTGLINNSRKLSEEAAETIALYNLTKDICKTLDEEKVFHIFKERVGEYLTIGDCQFLDKDADISQYGGETIFPLVIQKDIMGYLIAKDIIEEDKERFYILAQQFLIGYKRALLYKRMQELSITDSLTHLFSRRHFLERFNEELRRSKKFKYNFSFLMVDIDKFKDFNDNYGHLVGDAILREVSKTVKDTMRQIDFVGRYGGEELSVILVETDKEQARFAAERLRAAIASRNIRVYDEELKVTVSIGIATFPVDGVSSEALIEGADKALYMAKEEGRNRVKYLS